MAYGLISTTVLLSLGIPPATASASVHAAEVFTTGASGLSHWRFGNLDKHLFWKLAPAGMIGGGLGAYVLTATPGNLIRPKFRETLSKPAQSLPSGAKAASNARQGASPGDEDRRQLRPTGGRRRRRYRRGGLGRKGDWLARTREGAMDARGRHARRPLPTHVRARSKSRARCGRPAGRMAEQDRRPVDRLQHTFRARRWSKTAST